MLQDSAAFRVDGCGYAAQVGRFGAPTTLPFFIPEKMAHGAEIAEGGAVDRTCRIYKIYRILTDRGYRSARAFALRMGRLKIPNPTSELAGMRFFTPRS